MLRFSIRHPISTGEFTSFIYEILFTDDNHRVLDFGRLLCSLVMIRHTGK